MGDLIAERTIHLVGKYFERAVLEPTIMMLRVAWR